MVYIILVSFSVNFEQMLYIFTSVIITNFEQVVTAKAKCFVSIVNIVIDSFCTQIQTITL